MGGLEVELRLMVYGLLMPAGILVLQAMIIMNGIVIIMLFLVWK